MARCVGWFGVLLLSMVGSLRGAEVQVVVGTHSVPAAPGQVVDLHVSGGAQVWAFDLFLQVADGTSGPRITAVDLESGIFLGNHNGQGDAGSTDWLKFYSISVESDAIAASGLLVRLTIDATGVAAGSYPLVLTGIEVPGFGVLDSTFLDASAEPVPAQFTPGTLVVMVPEPAVGTLLVGAGMLLAGRRRGRRES